MLIVDMSNDFKLSHIGQPLDAYLRGTYDAAVGASEWQESKHPRAPKGAPDSRGGQFTRREEGAKEEDKGADKKVAELVTLPSGERKPKTFADYLYRGPDGKYTSHKESPFLRKMKGDGRVSEELSGILDHLFAGEDVPDQEIMKTPEWQEAIARETRGVHMLREKYGVEDTAEISSPVRNALRSAIKRAALLPRIHKYEVIPELGNQQLETNEGLEGDDSYEVAQDRQVFIAIGFPAAGKSTTYANPLAKKYRARLCDSDIIKKILPEFDNGYGGNLVHGESTNLNEQIIDEASDRGDNIVYPILGYKKDKLQNAIAFFRRKGYAVTLCFKDMPMPIAKGRLLVRFLQKGRYLPLGCISKVGDKLPSSFDANKGLCDAYIRSTNKDPYGGTEMTIEQKGKIL